MQLPTSSLIITEIAILQRDEGHTCVSFKPFIGAFFHANWIQSVHTRTHALRFSSPLFCSFMLNLFHDCYDELNPDNRNFPSGARSILVN